MNEGIRKYLRSTIPDADEQGWETFLAHPEVDVLLQKFETDLQKAWFDFKREEVSTQLCLEGIMSQQAPPLPKKMPLDEPVTETNSLSDELSPVPTDLSSSITKEPAIPSPRFTLRNGRQNEPYHQIIDITPSTDELQLLAVDVPVETGLRIDRDRGLLHGIPAVHGEFQIQLHYRYATDPEGSFRRGQVSLFINADPKSLWKNLPSDSQDPFWKEDEAAQILVGPEATLLAARRRGRSHAHVGSFCDDDFFLHHDNASGWYIAVIADGAGSASHSRHGSQVVVRAAGKRLQELLAEENGASLRVAVANALSGGDGTKTQDHHKHEITEALYYTFGHAAHAAVRALYEEQKDKADSIPSQKDLSTTLLIGISRRIKDKWFCAAYWVGDGAIGIYHAENGIIPLGIPDSGEYSGQTCFLDSSKITEEEIRKRLHFSIVDDMTAFILMTDGVADPYFETEALLSRKECWDALWQDIEKETALSSKPKDVEQRVLEWLNFWSPGNHDDRTIAILF